MTVFKPGDRVEYTGDVWPHLEGEPGVVVAVEDNRVSPVRVNFPADVKWCYRSSLKPIEAAKPQLTREGKGWDYIDAGAKPATDSDPVKHPNHYTWIPGIECMDVVKHFNFTRGAAIKYVWRAGRKGDKLKEIEDLRKAVENLNIEIKRLETTN